LGKTPSVTRLDDATRPDIGAYALIGDCRSAALVSRDGSLDWLCWPRFDSPSVFAALLDQERGGRFRVRPTGSFRTTRRYLPDTNIVETTFDAPTGTVVLGDLMPVSSEAAKRRELRPQHQVLREVEGRTGEVDIEVVYEPRPGYATTLPLLTDHGSHGFQCDAKPGLLLLRSEIPLHLAPDASAAGGKIKVREGEKYFLSFTY
jgi:GH15 family glucan-1,4-alpha-glucosidase